MGDPRLCRGQIEQALHEPRTRQAIRVGNCEDDEAGRAREDVPRGSDHRHQMQDRSQPDEEATPHLRDAGNRAFKILGRASRSSRAEEGCELARFSGVLMTSHLKIAFIASTMILSVMPSFAQSTPEEMRAVDNYFGKIACDTDAKLICQNSDCRRLSKKESGASSPLEVDVPGGKVFLGAARTEFAAKIHSRVGLKAGRLVMVRAEFDLKGRNAIITLSADSPEDTSRDGSMSYQIKPDDANSRIVQVLSCRPARS